MTAVSPKKQSQKDANQVLKLAFNDNDMTLSTSGFLDSNLGHRIKTLSPTQQNDVNYYYAELTNVASCTFTNGSPIVTLPAGVSASQLYNVGETCLMDITMAGIPDLTTIQSINSNTQITMSNNFTGTTGTYNLHTANLVKVISLYYNDAAHDVLVEAARIL